MNFPVVAPIPGNVAGIGPIVGNVAGIAPNVPVNAQLPSILMEVPNARNSDIWSREMSELLQFAGLPAENSLLVEKKTPEEYQEFLGDYRVLIVGKLDHQGRIYNKYRTLVDAETMLNQQNRERITHNIQITVVAAEADIAELVEELQQETVRFSPIAKKRSMWPFPLSASDTAHVA